MDSGDEDRRVARADLIRRAVQARRESDALIELSNSLRQQGARLLLALRGSARTGGAELGDDPLAAGERETRRER